MPKSAVTILTNCWGQKASASWRAATTYLPIEDKSLLSQLKSAITLYRKRCHFDCVVLIGDQSSYLFSLLQSILPFSRVPCILLDCLWTTDKNVIKHFFKKMLFKIAGMSIDKFVVWAKHETDDFSKAFDLPKDKFVFIPFHTTFERYREVKTTEGDYIFSGGNSDRDYTVLINSVRGLPVTLFIASTLPEYLNYRDLPKNVVIKGLSHEEFVQKMAGCRINIVTTKLNLLRSAGQQTYLNSMMFGKPTIVSDPGGADYIDHGENGLVVSPNNAAALREAIMSLWNHPEKAQEMGAKARQKANNYTVDEHYKKIISLMEELVKSKQNCSLSKNVGVSR